MFKRELYLLNDTSQNNFRVLKNWTRKFMKAELNWSYQATSTALGKLPKDYEE